MCTETVREHSAHIFSYIYIYRDNKTVEGERTFHRFSYQKGVGRIHELFQSKRQNVGESREDGE